MKEGSHFTPEQKNKISKSQTRSWYETPGKRERMSETTLIRFQDPREREKTRQGVLRSRILDPSILTRMAETQRIRLSDPEVRKTTSLGVKMAQALDPSLLKATWKGQAYAHTHLTKLEEIVYDVIKDYNLPYTYNSSTATVVIGNEVTGNRIPDFVHNTKKLVIETFGEYWHTFSDELIVYNHYRKFGYKVLVLWQNEIENQSEEDLYFTLLAFEGLDNGTK